MDKLEEIKNEFINMGYTDKESNELAELAIKSQDHMQYITVEESVEKLRNAIQADRDNDCFAVKSKDNLYFCGYNQWDKQLRKAKLYHWYRMAKEIAEDTRFMEREPYIVHVSIVENGVADYETL